MKKILFLTLLFAFNTHLLASEQGIFNNLSKANKALEQMILGKCVNGKKLAKKFLELADKELAALVALNQKSQLEETLQSLWEYNTSDEYTMTEIESIFAEANILASKLKLENDKSHWFEEVKSQCLK